ncbi:MAG: glycosyltransferase family 4 protein [Proteobacteria bacterium]|nr:glycosyltransferase family 4 protein [Pseudomonadota bacterium]
MAGRKTLIITAPPTILGGAATLARIMADHLGALGHAVTVAHYATLRAERELTGSLPRLLRGERPGTRRYTAWDGTAFVSVGCWLPELETPYYLDSPRWRRLVGAHDRHLAVGGTALVAAPLVAAGVPHLIWCASDMLGDRIDRRRAMAPGRRAYDRVCVAPFLAALERRILAGRGRVMGVSAYTVERMRAVCGEASRPIVRLPVPVDGARFRPPETPPAPGVVGFIGRLSDPRKNAALLLDAVALARRQGHDITAVLAGERPPDLVAYAARIGLADRVAFPGHVDEADLPAFYQGLDVFVIPSRQEGLNIAGVQAAASGVPIISTRCGGPEGYVTDGVTGFLTGFDAAQIAARITQVVTDRPLRDTLAANARAMAEAEYANGVFARTLDGEWRRTWDEGVEGA